MDWKASGCDFGGDAMLRLSQNYAAAILAATTAFTLALPAMAQYYYSDYGYPTTYVSPNYVTPYPTYVTPYPSYYESYYVPRRSVVRSTATGAAIGGAAGFGLSFLEPRHHRHYARNIGIGAGVGAGIGLLHGLFGD
jgi:hypothetical protein